MQGVELPTLDATFSEKIIQVSSLLIFSHHFSSFLIKSFHLFSSFLIFSQVFSSCAELMGFAWRYSYVLYRWTKTISSRRVVISVFLYWLDFQRDKPGLFSCCWKRWGKLTNDQRKVSLHSEIRFRNFAKMRIFFRIRLKKTQKTHEMQWNTSHCEN